MKGNAKMVRLLNDLESADTSVRERLAKAGAAARAMGKRAWKKFREEFMAEKFPPMPEGKKRTEEQRTLQTRWIMRLTRVEHKAWPPAAPEPEPAKKLPAGKKSKVLSNIVDLVHESGLTIEEVMAALLAAR